MDLEEKIERIAAALAELEKRERKILHAPPVSEAEVIAIEQEFGIVLPEEYRAFVTRIARGLYEPEIFGLDEDHQGGRGEVVSWAESELRLSEPFVNPLEWPDDEEGDAMEEEYLYGPIRGLVPIAHWGCQTFDFLVVTGTERGHIFRADLPYEYDLLRFDTGPATFLEYAMLRIGDTLAGRFDRNA